LTNYLLNANNFSEILKNIKICELLGSYCQLLQKLCCDQYVINSYPPDDFKNILSIKNPLFEGIQANDSKDLIYFLLEDFNKELNNLNLKINKNLIQNSNDDWIDDSKQSNRELMFETFIKTYSSENNNIIPKLFFSLIENETICNGCNTRKYNYQIVFSLELSLEVIYNKIYGNQNMNIGKKTLDLLQCLPNYNETNYFTGENAMYCNICQKQQESIYHKRIHSLSPILIIILNRGKGNQFDCDVNFPDHLNFQQNVINPSINVSYKLIGVVTHFGTSDMGGHFIAYCKHRILNEWYCYNDAAVSKLSDPKNEYKNGVPYILFYESEQGNQNILFDNVGNNNFQNIQNLNPNCNNNGFVLNNMNNMNFQNNINMMNNNIYNMNLNNNMNTNNNIQNNFMANSNINANNMFINNNFNNMNNNMNMMPNITNFNMNTNMNMNNIMNNNFNIQINNNNCNNINNNMNNNMINNINNNIINNINNNVINNMNNNNMNYNNNSNNIQFNNPNINGMNFPQINNMNNNYLSMNNNMNGN
jgi:ubiquitin C-terminal hydrolase